MPPKMIVVAGPPGGGKSSLFPVSSFGVSYFNADDRAAELNRGSYVGITKEIRAAVNREFEAFILACIDQGTSFAVETTLRSAVIFQQAALAKAAGFSTEMRYLALRDLATHLDRVKSRADAGGHSASEAVLSEAYESSLANLPRAILEIDEVWAYDNSQAGGPPKLVLQSDKGVIQYLVDDPPGWLTTILDLS